MTINQFYYAASEASNYTDREAFVSDIALSSEFLPPDDETAMPDSELLEQLSNLWDVLHMTVLDMQKQSGLTREQFAKRFCVPLPTLFKWLYNERDCTVYLRILMAESLGLLKR